MVGWRVPYADGSQWPRQLSWTRGSRLHWTHGPWRRCFRTSTGAERRVWPREGQPSPWDPMAVDSQILAGVNVAPSRRGTALTGAIHMARTLPTRRYPTTPLSTSPVSPPSPIATGRGPACPPRRTRRGSLRLGGRAHPRRGPPGEPLTGHFPPAGPRLGRVRQPRPAGPPSLECAAIAAATTNHPTAPASGDWLAFSLRNSEAPHRQDHYKNRPATDFDCGLNVAPVLWTHHEGCRSASASNAASPALSSIPGQEPRVGLARSRTEYAGWTLSAPESRSAIPAGDAQPEARAQSPAARHAPAARQCGHTHANRPSLPPTGTPAPAVLMARLRPATHPANGQGTPAPAWARLPNGRRPRRQRLTQSRSALRPEDVHSRGVILARVRSVTLSWQRASRILDACRVAAADLGGPASARNPCLKRESGAEESLAVEFAPSAWARDTPSGDIARSSRPALDKLSSLP